jgi:ankyrin repeat protein
LNPVNNGEWEDKFNSLMLIHNISKHEIQEFKYPLFRTNDDKSLKKNCNNTLVQIAAFAGKYDKIKYLIEDIGINVNSPRNNGSTALHDAVHQALKCCSHNHKKCVEQLLGHKADVFAQTKSGFTPIHHTCWSFEENDGEVKMRQELFQMLWKNIIERYPTDKDLVKNWLKHRPQSRWYNDQMQELLHEKLIKEDIQEKRHIFYALHHKTGLSKFYEGSSIPPLHKDEIDKEWYKNMADYYNNNRNIETGIDPVIPSSSSYRVQCN